MKSDSNLKNQTLSREYTSTSQSWRNPLFVVLIPRYRPDVSGFLWHTAEAINWIKVYSPMQAELFTASALLPDIIKHNESPKVTSATIIRTRETWELFCGLTIQPTFRNATTHSVFPAKCRLKKSSAEISYWWRVTTQIWKVLLIGWSKFPYETNDQKFYSDLESERSLAWNFCARPSDVISQGN